MLPGHFKSFCFMAQSSSLHSWGPIKHKITEIKKYRRQKLRKKGLHTVAVWRYKTKHKNTKQQSKEVQKKISRGVKEKIGEFHRST